MQDSKGLIAMSKKDEQLKSGTIPRPTEKNIREREIQGRKWYINRIREMVADKMSDYPICDCPNKTAYGESPSGIAYAGGYIGLIELCDQCYGIFCHGDYPEPPKCPNCGFQDYVEPIDEGKWGCGDCGHTWPSKGLDGHPDGPFPDDSSE